MITEKDKQPAIAVPKELEGMTLKNKCIKNFDKAAERICFSIFDIIKYLFLTLVIQKDISRHIALIFDGNRIFFEHKNVNHLLPYGIYQAEFLPIL